MVINSRQIDIEMGEGASQRGEGEGEGQISVHNEHLTIQIGAPGGKSEESSIVPM